MKPKQTEAPSLMLLFTLALFLAGHVGQTEGAWLFNAERAAKPRILFDYHHHLKPGTRVGQHLVTGGYADNVGRYGWDDFSHTNSFDPLFTALDPEFALLIHEEPFTNEALEGIDGVAIVNPDHPDLTPTVPVISDEEIAVLQRYVRKGGSLLVLINSAGHATEKFETAQLRKLVNSFGLDWNDDNTKYSDIAIGPRHPYFYDVPVFHYGAGCTLRILESAEEPAILMEVYADQGYPDTHVRGAGIVMVRPGKGKVILVGDTGSWGANISRPWAENARVLVQMFNYLKPDRGARAPEFHAGEELKYRATVTQMSGIPVKNSLRDLPRPQHRNYNPRPKTLIPYLEASGELTVRSMSTDAMGATGLEVDLDSFGLFEKVREIEGEETVTLTASRQGNVSGVMARGEHAQWLAPDIPSLVALIPVDGIRPGDGWDKVFNLRIPTIQGSDPATTKPVEMRVTYVRDETVNGRQCRLLQASREVWLNEIGVRIEDVLPQEEIRQWGGAHYEMMAKRGGTLLVKRQQWVDAETGRVVKARTQSRIVAWIHDLEKPIGSSNEEIDNEMVTAFSHMVTFERK